MMLFKLSRIREPPYDAQRDLKVLLRIGRAAGPVGLPVFQRSAPAAQ